MNSTLTQLNARRAWLVPALAVTGDLSAETIDSLATETDDSVTRVVFYQFTVGGQAQEITFANLTDHRGNSLPTQIDRPVVVPIRRNAVGVAVVGTPTDTTVRLAKTENSADDGLVDLWIIEAGR